MLHCHVDEEVIRKKIRHLSPVERLALCRMVVAGEIHQVSHANDKAFARRLRGYTIVMPCNVAQVLNTRVHGVPRRDLAAWVKIIFRGTPQTYATKIAAQLNNERARMDYKTLAEQIRGL